MVTEMIEAKASNNKFPSSIKKHIAKDATTLVPGRNGQTVRPAHPFCLSLKVVCMAVMLISLVLLITTRTNPDNADGPQGYRRMV